MTGVGRYYNHVPSFYFNVDPGWRGYYRDHNWNGHRWNYERISNQRLQQNWKSWHNNRYWEKQGTWGVQGYHPRSQQQRQELRHQRQQQYQQRPEVQHHQLSHGQGQQHHGELHHHPTSLMVRASNTMGNYTTNSLMENMQGGMLNIESRRTRSLKTLPPI